MVRRLLPSVIFLMAGCASAPPLASAPRPVEVRVPVYEPVYCGSGTPARPALPIAGLNPNSRPAETIKAYAASVALLKGAVIQLDSLLAGCAGPVNKEASEAGMHG